MDNFTLFTSTLLVLLVMAVAFAAASVGKRDNYWYSWIGANLSLALAALAYMLRSILPEMAVVAMPGALLLLGFGLRWGAARQFNGRKVLPSIVLAPALLMVVVSVIPFTYQAYGLVFATANMLLAALAVATAWEFMRDHKRDRLASRIGLMIAYGLMAVAFLLRNSSLFLGGDAGRPINNETMVGIYLLISLIFTTGSGAFCLLINFERIARQLREAASVDALTGLYNRGAFEAHVNELLTGVDRKKFAVALFDLDHFKQINDTHGHEAGDAALKLFAQICRDVMRPGDCVARIGGEEFAVVLPETDNITALALAERIRLLTGKHEIRTSRTAFNMTVSVGICESRAFDHDYDAIMRAADRYLYAAKNGGRNQVQSQAAA